MTTTQPVLTSIAAIEYGEAPRKLDLLGPYPLPATPVPVIVRTTGAGWVEEGSAGAAMQARPPGARFLAAAGFLVAVVSHRMSWQAAFPAQLHDLQAAIRWLRVHAGEYPIDPNHIGIIGDSAGGHLAALAALTGDRSGAAVQAAVAISAPSDFLSFGGVDPHQPQPSPPIRFARELNRGDALTQLFGGPLADRQDLMRFASPLTHVHKGAPPFLIVHGTLDETVPFDQGRRLHEGLVAAGVDSTFVPIEGGYHNLRDVPDIPYPSPVWDRVGDLAIEFFTRTL
ncbi:MAG TPA: alpha/beta hydrolase [Mycobacteriales bacterium]|nr:alpha/beta hydrolase [Mycobacteriales bacterium]